MLPVSQYSSAMGNASVTLLPWHDSGRPWRRRFHDASSAICLFQRNILDDSLCRQPVLVAVALRPTQRKASGSGPSCPGLIHVFVGIT